MISSKSMRRVFSILSKEGVIIALASILLLFFSYSPLVIGYLNPPEGKVHTGSLGYPQDFYGNLINWQQGRLGHILARSKISSTISSPSSLYRPEYLTLGLLSRILPFESVVSFHVVRFTLSVLLLLATYILICRVFSTKLERISAYLLALFSTAISPPVSWVHWILPVGYDYLTDYWSPLAVFQRYSYYPHYLISGALTLFLFVSLAQTLKELRPKRLIVSSILGVLAAQSHPPVILITFLILPIYLLFSFLKGKDFGILIKKSAFLLFFSLVSLIPILYFRFGLDYFPYNLMQKGDTEFFIRATLPQYVLGMGLTLPLAILGLKRRLNKKDDLSLLVTAWPIAQPLGFYFVSKIIHINSARFLQVPFFVFWSILAVDGLIFLSEFLKKRITRITISAKEILIILLTLVLSTSSLSWTSSYYWSLVNFTNKMANLVYINKYDKEAFDWLGKNSKEEDIVLSEPQNSTFIAALQGNWVYLSGFAGYYLEGFDAKEKDLRDFYGHKMKDQQARDFLKKWNISYVYWGEREKDLSANQRMGYKILEPVYANSGATIFKVLP